MPKNNPVYTEFASPIGRLRIVARDRAIVRIAFDCDTVTAPMGRSALLDEACRQLTEYFEGKRRAFDLPAEPAGTEFQSKVWRALTAIPYGETATYGQISAAIGQPKAARAVGMANHANPLPILIPCHRVIAADGRPAGYRGGKDAQAFLLGMENNR